MVIEYQYADAEVFSESGHAPIKVKDWGFIDKKGNLVIPANYGISTGASIFGLQSDKGFTNGLARVKYKKQWGFIDTQGNPIGNKWFQNAEPFSAPLKK
jgi:hypothetical protein